MRMLNDVKISTKLTSGVLIGALLVLAIGLLGYVSQQKTEDVAEYHFLMSMPALSLLEKISTKFEIMHSDLMIRATDLDAKRSYDFNKNNLSSLIRKYDSLALKTGRDGERLAGEGMRATMQNYTLEMRASLQRYDDIVQELFILHKTNKKEDKILARIDDLHNERNKFREILKNDKSMEYLGAEKQHRKIITTRKNIKVITIISTILTFLLALALGYFVFKSSLKPIRELKKASEEIRKGNFKHRIDVKSKDEIGELGIGFNEMAAKLKESYEGLEKKKGEVEEEVKKRTKEFQEKLEELEQFQKLAVGRELKMIELKKALRQVSTPSSTRGAQGKKEGITKKIER